MSEQTKMKTGDGSADGSEDDGADEGQMRRLEDLSEDDFEVGDSDDELSENEEEARELRRALGIQLQSWLDEDGRAEQPVEQQPLRCILCPKSLLLNPHSLRRYLSNTRLLRVIEACFRVLPSIHIFVSERSPPAASAILPPRSTRRG